jgi:xanthine dehydrogenase small subunit
MIEFILNNQTISTDLSPGTTVLDFVRYHENLKGTKIGCREGDCGACTILVGEPVGDEVSYRSMTSCLMPLANAAGKHIVSIEGINRDDGGLTPVQQAMLDESGTQCGFCTVGFVMSLTGFCLDNTEKTPDLAISSIDGNICRCTGYKSIERAAERICDRLRNGKIEAVPAYFTEIPNRLEKLNAASIQAETRPIGSVPFVGGGTDVYVQKPEHMTETEARPLFYDDQLRGVRDMGDYIEIGASATVTDLLVSPVMQGVFPALYKHLKLISSTPIRNMATLAGNFANASPIGDMTIWFLALNAEIILSSQGATAASDLVRTGSDSDRVLSLRDFYLGYKQLDKSAAEYITAIRFAKPKGDFRFNFEKVSKRTYLDIATVNTAISVTTSSPPYKGGVDAAAPLLSEEGRRRFADGVVRSTESNDNVITEAHLSAGGVAPIPLYLKQTSAFLKRKPISAQTIAEANEIMQSEISPISDIRGTAAYKRLLLRQLFTAHFVELFGQDAV